MKINLREASTKRGIVMAITGGVVLYQTVFGSGSADVDALLDRVEWWLGIGITLAGLLGLLPDEPKTTHDPRSDHSEMPLIELQGRSELPVDPSAGSAAAGSDTMDDHHQRIVAMHTGTVESVGVNCERRFL